MAGQGRKVFTAGDVLTAAQVQDYLQDQAVMYFADAASRATAIPSPTEGMVTYRSDIDALEVYNAASYVPVNKNVVSYVIDTAATLTLTTTTETSFFSSPSFTPVASRLYEITVTIGLLTKTTGTGNMTIRLRKDSVSGTVLSTGNFVVQTVNMGYPYTKTIVGTLGSTAFVPTVTVQANTNGMTASNTTYEGSIIIKDIGLA